jgi:uncharacterized protein (TIGR02145 family)
MIAIGNTTINNIPPLSAVYGGMTQIWPVDAGYVEINTIKWANVNLIPNPNDPTGMTSIFAPRPDMPTGFYQFGREKAHPATGAITDWDNSVPAAGNWAAENSPAPSGWRLPTESELEVLLMRSTHQSFVAAGERGALVGGMFVGTTQAAADNATIDTNGNVTSGCLFFPITGERYYANGNLLNVDYWSHYWCSNEHTGAGWEGTAYALSVHSNQWTISVNQNKAAGCNIRCVKI